MNIENDTAEEAENYGHMLVIVFIETIMLLFFLNWGIEHEKMQSYMICMARLNRCSRCPFPKKTNFR